MVNTSLLAAFERMWQHVTYALGGKSDISHNHDDTYYTESEIDTKISSVNTSITNITNGTTKVGKATVADSAATATSATTASTATKATQDGNGKVISSTYETKTDASAKLTEAKTYTDSAVSDKADVNHNHDNDYDTKGSAETVQDALDVHIGNSDIHFTATERTKLSGIETGAQKNIITGIKGDSENEYRTGNINITKENIGLSNVNNTSDANKPVSTAQQTAIDSALDTAKQYTDTKISGLAANSSVTSAINTHNTSSTAHSDIRELITGLTTRLNALADSDDTTLDQMSEVVDYIKSNKSLIDSITTSKINVSDIVDNLTTNSTSKVLSAKQGVALKGLIDTLQAAVDNKASSDHSHTITAGASDDDVVVLTGTNGTNKVTYSASHANSGVTAGTYKSVTVNAKGHVTAGSNPTTLSGYGITNAYTKTEIDGLLDDKSDVGHAHVIADVSGLQTALDNKADSSHGTHVSFDSTNKPKMDGTAAFGTSSKVARADHVHPTDTSRATKTEFDSHVADTTKHITSTERTNWGVAYTHSQSTHAPSNAQANQNAFSNVKVGTTTITADTTTDTLELVGSNVTITPDATNDKVTISVADGSTSAKGIVKLTNSTSSTSTTTAATPSSVKSAYDLANTAKTNAATAQSKADSAYSLAEGKVDSLSDLGVTATATELNCVDGVTSNVQTQLDALSSSVNGKADTSHSHSISDVTNLQSSLDAKQTTITGAATTITGSNLTANRALISNGSGKVAVSAVTSTELGYLDGVTSGIQAQLDGKANLSHGTHVSYSSTTPVMDGTASVGSASTVARSDHKHPTDTSRLAAANVLNNVTTTQAGYALDARQGKILQDQITELLSSSVISATTVNSNLIGNFIVKKGIVHVNIQNNTANQLTITLPNNLKPAETSYLACIDSYNNATTQRLKSIGTDGSMMIDRWGVVTGTYRVAY